MDSKSSYNILVFVCLVLFFDSVGVGLILPVLPDLIKEISDLPNSKSAVIAGYLLFVFAFMQFFFSPILGGLSDKLGRRPVLLIALLGFSLDYFVMAAAPTLMWLFIARIISGIFGATYAVANACIVDISSAEDRAKFFGYTGAAVGLGFVFGPAIGGVLGEHGTRLPFIAAGVITFITFIYGYFALPETLPTEKRRDFDIKRANPIGSLIVIRRYPVVITIIAAIFVMQLANQSYIAIWSFFTIEVTNWSPLNIGLSVAFYGIILAIIQGGFTGRIVERFGEVRAIIFSLIVGIISAVGLALAANGNQIYFWIFIAGFSAFAFPSMQAIMTRRIPENSQGELQGAISSSYSLSAIIGPLFMTQLFGIYTSGDGVYFPGAPFIGAAILTLISLIIFIFGARTLTHSAKL